jgi:AsmA-like protein
MLRKLLMFGAILVAAAALAFVLVLRGTFGSDAVRRTFERELSSRIGQPVSIASVTLALFPRAALQLHDVRIGQPATMTMAAVSVTTGLRGLFSKRIEDATLTVEKSRIPFGALGLLALGATPPDGAPASDGFTIVSIRTVAFRDVELAGDHGALAVDLDASVEGDRMTVARVIGRSGSTRLEARGQMTSLAQGTGKFVATANPLNLEELLGVLASGPASARGDRNVRGSNSSLDITVDLTAPAGRAVGYEFRDLSSKLRVRPAVVTAQPLEFKLFGGVYAGSLRADFGGVAPLLAIGGKLSGVDLAGLLASVGATTSVTGTAGGTFTLNGSGSNGDQLLRTLHGSGTMTIADGNIPRLDLVRAIVLAFGKPSGVPPEGSGTRFSRIAATFALANRTLRSDDLTLASRDLDLAGRSEVNLASGAVSVRANAALSRELTAQAGTDLRRYAEDDGRVTVPVTIGGTLSQPTVGIDVAGVLNRAIQNELKRRMRGLFDKIIK